MSTPDFQLPRHRLTVDEYYRMAELGILAPDARVELIEGEIIDMTPQGSRHAAIVSRLNERLISAVGVSAMVRCQLPIRLGTRSEPEPDFAIVKRHADDYMDGHPVAEDVLLLIEISNTTTKYDRLIKVPLYARHGVVETWLVEVPLGRVHLFRSPQHGSYSDVSVVERPGILHAAALPSVPIDFAGLLEAP
jgi:Uma2 family endonuclease